MAARQTPYREVSYRRHTLLLRVSGVPGEPYEVSLTDKVPWDRTPILGASLPVTVSAADPTNVQIEWERAPSVVDAATAIRAATKSGDARAAAEALGFKLREPED
jgi:hypothetical protein